MSILLSKDARQMNNTKHKDVIATIKKTEKGFTLVELLVAILLFNIGFLAILGLQIQALAMIGDSQLKNQALMFASSSHEIYLLSEEHAHSASHLSGLWAKNIYSHIPEVSYKREVLATSGFSISLYWPAIHGSTACPSLKQNESDCLHL